MTINQNHPQSELLKDLTIAIVGGSSAPIIEFSLAKFSSRDLESTAQIPQNPPTAQNSPTIQRDRPLSKTSPDLSLDPFGITFIGFSIGLLIAIGIFTFRRLNRVSGFGV